MFPATCLNPSCRHSFSAGGDGPLACPSCGGSTVARQDVVATLEPDVPPPSPAVASTLDGEGPSDPDTNPGLPSPVRLGRFILDRVVGRGAFGEVYRAHDPQLDRVVALKVAKAGTLDSPERVGRFLREARAAANLRHPHIVPVYDSGVDGGRHYIASGFIDGRTLAAEIDDADGKPLGLRRAADVVRRLAEALGYAHRQGVVHRDVKPANVLVDAAGEPSLTDFGLAIRDGDEAVKTRDDRVLGTPAYMSPEQAAGKSADATAASDQYALGVMLYEMATGHRPFDGRMEVVLARQVHALPPRPRSENRAIPRDLETVILKCLEKDPAKRYPSCEALADDLRRFLAGEPVVARRIGPLERTARWAKRNPAVAGSLAFAFLALVAGTAVSLWQRDEARAAAASEAEQKKKADEKSDLATAEAKRANENKALADTEAAAAKAEAKENLRMRDLGRVQYASVLWASGQVQPARDALADVAVENRCVVWKLLRRTFEGGLFVLRGHTGPVTAVDCSPDGRWIASAADATVRVWDARTGAAARVVASPRGAVAAVAFSPDGKLLAFACGDQVRAVNLAIGEERLLLSDDGCDIRALAFAPGGALLAVAGINTATVFGGRAGVWAVPSGKLVGRLPLPGGSGHVFRCCFSPDGQRLLTADGLQGRPQAVRQWDVAGMSEVSSASDSTGPLTALAVSPDGRQLVSGWGDRVGIRDAETGRLLAELPGEPGRRTATAFAPDGSAVAVAAGNQVQVWTANPARPALRVTLTGHSDAVTGVAFSPDATRIVTGSRDGTVRVWDARSALPSFLLADPSGVTEVPSLSADGTTCAVGGRDHAVRVWDMPTGAVTRVLKGHTDELRGVHLAGDGTRIASGSWDKTARVWDARTGVLLRVIGPLPGKLTTVRLSPDGQRLATVLSAVGPTPSPVVQVWELAGGGPVWTSRGPLPAVGEMRFTPDGTRLLTAHFTNGLRVWDADSGAEVGRLAGNFNALAVSPDGSVVAGADAVWTLGTVRRVFGFRAGDRGGVAVGFSADGRRLISAAETIRFWDVAGGQLMASLPNDERARYIATASAADAVLTGATVGRVWDLSPPAESAALPGHDAEVRALTVIEPARAFATADGLGVTLAWDLATGDRLAELPKGGRTVTAAVSPDGRFLFALASGRVIRWPLTADSDEVRRRTRLTRPEPDWHWSWPLLPPGSGPFAVAFHRSREQFARGLQAAEACDFDGAQKHFLAAALLKPKPHQWPAVAPPPRPVR